MGAELIASPSTPAKFTTTRQVSAGRSQSVFATHGSAILPAVQKPRVARTQSMSAMHETAVFSAHLWVVSVHVPKRPHLPVAQEGSVDRDTLAVEGAAYVRSTSAWPPGRPPKVTAWGGISFASSALHPTCFSWKSQYPSPSVSASV